MIATKMFKKANATHVAIINALDPNSQAYNDHFEWSSEGETDRPDTLIEKLDESYCAPKGNVVERAYQFWNTREPFDAY